MRSFLALLAAAALLTGCASSRVPDPKPTLDAYVKAAQSGDDAALFDLMTEKSKERLGRDGAKRAVTDAKDELRDLGAAASAKDASRKTEAKVGFEDGDVATLVLEDGAFKLVRADGLPPAAKSPREALSALRRALLRAELGPLSRVMTREARDAAQKDIAGLVRDLAHPSQLDVRVQGDKAQVTTPSGHAVKLRRANGVWSVEEFD